MAARRGYAIAALLVTIVCSFGYAIIRYQANSPVTENAFNRHWRQAFAAHATLRWLFGLHRDGDNRAAYLDTSNESRLDLVVVADPTVTVPTEALEQAAVEIADVLRKPGRVTVVTGGTLTASPAYSTQQIRMLPRPTTQAGRAVLYVYLLTSAAEAPSHIGTTVREDGIALFLTELQSLTNRNPATLSPLVTSTVLHEAGHQLGLQHADDPTCIMAPSVEQPSSAPVAAGVLPVAFCTQEQAVIAALQQSR